MSKIITLGVVVFIVLSTSSLAETSSTAEDRISCVRDDLREALQTMPLTERRINQVAKDLSTGKMSEDKLNLVFENAFLNANFLGRMSHSEKVKLKIRSIVEAKVAAHGVFQGLVEQGVLSEKDQALFSKYYTNDRTKYFRYMKSALGTILSAFPVVPAFHGIPLGVPETTFLNELRHDPRLEDWCARSLRDGIDSVYPEIQKAYGLQANVDVGLKLVRKLFVATGLTYTGAMILQSSSTLVQIRSGA